MKLRALALHVMLTLLLLLSQQLGIAHSVTHLSHPPEKSSSRDEQLPSELHCAHCLAFASIDSALNAVTHASDIDVETCAIEAGIRPATPLNDPLRAFQPRAPPLLS